jgi:UPF0755 protein
MFSKYKTILIAFALVTLVAVFGAYYFLFSANTTKKYELKVSPNTTFEVVLKELKENGILKNNSTFEAVSSFMKYKGTVPSGRYLIKEGMNNRKLIGKLRSGDQDPLNLTFNNVWTIQELAGKLSKSLAADSLTLLNSFIAPNNLSKYNLNPQTALTLFVPNTYDIFWDIDPDKLMQRMDDERNKFWNKERLSKAQALNLNKEQVYTLASIVERESNNKKERPTVAGVYLNRLRIGDKLRADPTVVYANGDFLLRRVLFQHLNFDSPYNTYMYGGLPPGPIFMPSTNAIDAVLDYEKHDYFFFCAKPGYNSEHAFAKTAEQHQQNANVYHRWLTSEGIK